MREGRYTHAKEHLIPSLPHPYNRTTAARSTAPANMDCFPLGRAIDEALLPGVDEDEVLLSSPLPVDEPVLESEPLPWLVLVLLWVVLLVLLLVLLLLEVVVVSSEPFPVGAKLPPSDGSELQSAPCCIMIGGKRR